MLKNLILILSLTITGCASVNSVSLSPIPADRSHLVTAETSKLIFLAFNFNNDFVDTLVSQLKEKCPNGLITGILTKDEEIVYFLFHRRKVTATGYCTSVPKTKAAHL